MSSPYRHLFLSFRPNCATQSSPGCPWQSQLCCQCSRRAGRAGHAKALSCRPGPRPRQEAARVARDTTCRASTPLTIPVVDVDVKHTNTRICALAWTFIIVCMRKGVLTYIQTRHEYPSICLNIGMIAHICILTSTRMSKNNGITRKAIYIHNNGIVQLYSYHLRRVILPSVGQPIVYQVHLHAEVQV